MRILSTFRPSQSAWAVIVAVSLSALSPALAGGGDSTVVATVGSHKITEADLDAKVKPEMAALESKIYDLKHQALESMADEYLLEQAAKKDKLTVPEYLKKQIGDKAPQVSEADARKYYDQRKGPGTPAFDQIKTRLIAALQNQSDQEQREKVLASLRKETPTKILIKAPRVEVGSAGHPSLGSADAPITIVEFSDFQCPFCKRVEPALKEIREKYGDKVRLVYMDYPLPMHNHALDAAKAGRCAAEQGNWTRPRRAAARRSRESSGRTMMRCSRTSPRSHQPTSRRLPRTSDWTPQSLTPVSTRPSTKRVCAPTWSRASNLVSTARRHSSSTGGC
jgi:hypothetical protein